MAIIIRESKNINGKVYEDLKVYKSDSFVISPKDEKKAEAFDDYLKKQIESILKDVKKNGLYKLKSKSGVIKLWYYVGKRLAFIDDPEILHPADRKFIWKAIWYHAKELAPGDAKTRAGTVRDHFSYCYRIAKYNEEFVYNAGTWGNWIDLFDSPICSNYYFLEWLNSNVGYIKEKKINGWLRKFIKEIKHEFQNKDMSFLSQEYIKAKCDGILNNFILSL